MNYITKFSWTLLGNIIFGTTQWAILLLLTKFAGLEIVGIYGFAFAYSSTLIMLFNLGLHQIYLTQNLKDYYRSLFFIRLFLSVILLGISIIFLSFKNYDGLSSLIFINVVIWKITDSLFELIYSSLQKEMNQDRIAISKIVRSIITFSAFLIFIVKGDIVLAFTSFTILALSLFIFEFIFVILKKRLFENQKKINFKFVKKILIIGIPLAFSHMFSSLNLTMPNFFLEFFGDLEDVAFFSSLMIFNSAGTIVIFAIVQIFIVKLVQLKENLQFKKILSFFHKILIITFLMLLFNLFIAKLFSYQILTSIFTTEYGQLTEEYLLFTSASLFFLLSLILNSYLLAFRKYNIQFIIQFSSLVITAILALYFIPSLGLQGAVYTFLISSIIEAVIKILIVRGMIHKSKFIT